MDKYFFFAKKYSDYFYKWINRLYFIGSENMKKKIVKKNDKDRRSIAVVLTFILITSALTTISFNRTAVSKIEKPYTTLFTQAGWEIQESGTTQTLWGVSFVDTSISTVVGDSSTILHTEDEGENWITQTCGPSVNLFDVSFYDVDIGMAVGYSGTILNTTNAGDSWDTVQTGWNTFYYGAHMVTSTVGFAVGENTIFQPLVTWTTDGWQTLNNVAFYLEHQSVLYEGELWDVHFINSTMGFVAARVWNDEGAIARTTDGGWNWDTIFWADSAFYGIDFPSANVGYAVGLDGIIAKTSDGGDNWELLTSGVNNLLVDVSFSTENIGTAVGENGLIIRTENGGSTWSIQDSGTSNHLLAVDFLDSLNGFAVGNYGTILHTTTGGMSNLPPDTPGVPDGPDEGVTGVEYTFTASTTDPDKDQIYYMFDWGDGTFSDWLGPEDSGIPVEGSHAWDEVGDYDVRVKAKDVNDSESDWSDAHTIIIILGPELEIGTIKGGLFKVSAVIKNNGSADASNVQWSIKLDGGIILLGKETTGTDNIPADGDITVTSKLIFGLGPTKIKVTAEVPGCSDTKQKNSIVLFFIIL